jgi:putative glutamate/gamma-aminobutyrate antiporter
MNKNSAVKLGVLTLVMMNVAAVMSLRGIPMMAKEGISMIFYLLFASLLFLIPVSLVAAELATGWPQSGGVYRWVKEAFGSELGFTAIWLQWIQNVIWYPTVLTFAAGSLSYLFLDPDLAGNKFFNLAVVLIVYWGATFAAFRGARTSGKLTTLAVTGGTLVPGVLIIVLGLIWLITGNTLEFLVSPGSQHSIFPDLSNFDNVSFLAGIVLLFAGMEVGAVHVIDLKEPNKQFPKAVFLAMFVIIIIFSLGSLSIAAVLPEAKISLNSGIMQGLDDLLARFHIHWLLPVLGFLTAFGAVGGVLAWIAGPSKGLLATAKEGELPPFMSRTNSAGVQTNILYIQGAIVTLISLVYVIMPNVSSAFFLLTALTAVLYLIMYILLYSSAIKLRYSHPEIVRPYKIPGGKAGIWIVAGVGLLAVLFAFFIGFFPPAQLTVGSPAFYIVFLISGVVVFVGAPIVINKLKKPRWIPQSGDQQNK